MQVNITPGSVAGEVAVPFSKSLTHRAVILASLAEGESVIENPLVSDDTIVTIEACRQFGADIKEQEGRLIIQGTGGTLKIPDRAIDCAFSGTSLRLLTAIASLVPGTVRLTGKARLLERPMEPLLEALKYLGTKAWREGEYIVIEGGTLRGGEVSLPGDTSSQFISAVLMIAPYAQGTMSIILTGMVRSRPYIDLTIQTMHTFGIGVKSQVNVLVIPHGCYRGIYYQVEGDWSAAQYWVAAAAVTGGMLTLTGVQARSSQGDRGILAIAETMGCRVQVMTDGITVLGPRQLKPIKIDGGDIPDLVPTIAIMAAFADGTSTITNIAHLRGKESDRLAVPLQELTKMGIHAAGEGDALVIQGGIPKGTVIDSHNDHRIAMAFAVAGLGAEGETVIAGAEAVSKSYPAFWDDFGKIRNTV